MDTMGLANLLMVMGHMEKTEMSEEKIELPEDAEEIAGFSDINTNWLTVNRTPDGTVYVASWYYGVETVLVKVSPDGAVTKSDL